MLQEIFPAVHHSICDFERRNHGNFRNWLWTIPLNKVRGHQRKSSRLADLQKNWASRKRQLRLIPSANQAAGGC